MQSICKFDPCDKPARKRGWCHGHYAQSRSGVKLTPLRLYVGGGFENKLAAYAIKGDGCWEWAGLKSDTGYGLVDLDGKRQQAHRASFEHFKGPIPEGFVIDHMCHNPACVNPAHLQAVSNKENIENRAGANENTSSGVRGVYWHKPTGKWRGHVRHEGRQYSAGYHRSLADAEAAVTKLRRELFTNSLRDQ